MKGADTFVRPFPFPPFISGDQVSEQRFEKPGAEALVAGLGLSGPEIVDDSFSL